MAKGKLYEYAVIYHPRKKSDKDDPKKSELLVEPKTVLAENEQEVGILAARGIPDEYVDKLADVEVVVRPF